MDNLTTSISPLVIDLAIAAIILLVACLRAKAGIYHCVMSIVVIILAVAIGLVGSKILTPIIKEKVWEGYYKQQVEDKFDAEVAAALEGTETFSQSFKDSWNNFIESFGTEKVSMLKIEKDDVDYSDSQLVLKFRALTLYKAELYLEKLVHVICFGAITGLSLLLLTLLKNLLEKVADFSVIGWVNHGLGFLLGFVEIVVICIVVVRGSGMLGITFFSDISEGTVLLNWLVGGDISGTLTDLQNMTIDDLKDIKIEDLTTVDFSEVSDEAKELISGLSSESTPEEIQEVIDKIDMDQVSDEVKEILEAIDTEGWSDKAQELVEGVTDSATDKAKEAIKNFIN